MAALSPRDIRWDYAVLSVDLNTHVFTCVIRGETVRAEDLVTFFEKLKRCGVVDQISAAPLETPSDLVAALRKERWEFVGFHQTPHVAMITHFMKRATIAKPETALFREPGRS